MTKYEWDYPPTMRPRRKARIETVEILPPRQPERTVRIDVHHHHRSGGISPQRIIVVAAFAVLGLILLRSPGALIMLAVLIPPTVWIACGLTVVLLAIIGIRERVAGRNF
jgi:hypothetical protein